MTPNEFDALASAGYNHIPLVRELLADLDTPLSTYLKLGAGRYSYLFESVQGGEKWGRYSIIGLAATTVIEACENEVSVRVDGDITEQLSTRKTRFDSSANSSLVSTYRLIMIFPDLRAD